MSEYDDTNRGALFQNDKRTTENHPHAKGSLNVEGVEYWVSAWTKTSKNGKRYQSISITKKEDQTVAQPTAQPVKDIEFDDDLPF